MSELIRDEKGRLIGQIIESGNVTFIRDEHGQLRGSYNKAADKSYDGHGHLVGPGDQLLRLLD
jgi:hypothetical protein